MPSARSSTPTTSSAGDRAQRSGNGGPVYTWGYDAKDRITSYGDPLGVREVTYDDEDQIKRVVRREAGDRHRDVQLRLRRARQHHLTRVPGRHSGHHRLRRGQPDHRSRPRQVRHLAVRLRRRRAGAPAPTLPGADRADGEPRLRRRGTAHRRSAPNAHRQPVAARRAGPGVEVPDRPRPGRQPRPRSSPPAVVSSESVAYAYDDVDRVKSACYAAADCGKNTAKRRAGSTTSTTWSATAPSRSGPAPRATTSRDYDYDAANQLAEEDRAAGPGLRRDTDYDVRPRRQPDQGRAATGRATTSTTRWPRPPTPPAPRRRSPTTQRVCGSRLGIAAASTTKRWSWDVNGTLPQIAVDTITKRGRCRREARRSPTDRTTSRWRCSIRRAGCTLHPRLAGRHREHAVAGRQTETATTTTRSATRARARPCTGRGRSRQPAALHRAVPGLQLR